MNLVISATGTSILKHLVTQEELNSLIDRDIQAKDKQSVIRIEEKARKKLENTNIEPKIISSEINSLNKMAEKRIIAPLEDKIYLLYSDTLDGYIATIMVKKYLEEKLGFNNVEKVLLENIKITNTKNFIEGSQRLNNFLYEKVIKESDNLIKIIINITAGFKCLLPIFTMFYLELKSRNIHTILCYLFENQEDIISYKFNNDNQAVFSTWEDSSITLNESL